jgi:two-component system, cell cycle sensor histidine kinase and response regulator CckA
MSALAPKSNFPQPFPNQPRQLLYGAAALGAALAMLFVFWRRLVFSADYLPHTYCYLKQSGLVWTHVTADSLIGLSYFSISITLAYLVLKGHGDIPFRWMFLAFGLFIITCGSTHGMEVVTVWIPVYILSAAIKVVTAAASVSTAVALPFMVPQILGLVHEANASEERKRQMERALAERNAAQAALERANQHLEEEVKARTSELGEANAALRAEVEERGRVQASLAKLAFIVESSDDAIVGKDLKGTITSWNRGAERLYGYQAAEVIGKPITIIVPNGSVDEITGLMHRIARGEHVEHYETKRITKSGLFLDVSLTVSPLCNSEGVIIGASTIARDITTAKRAEEALRQSEEQYRLLFDGNPIPMWVFDRKTLNFLAVNEAAIRHYGFTRDEFFRMTILDIRPSEDMPRPVQHMSKPVPGPQDPQVWHHRKKDGAIIDVEVTAHDLNFHGADAEMVLAHDVTERKRAEERLRQSEERFSKAFLSSPYGVTISTEAEGRYVDANPAYLRMIGYRWEELVGRTALELKIWADPDQRGQWLQLLNASDRTKLIEARFRTKAGEIRLVQIAAERIQLHDEACVLAIVQDVTQARQLEEQFLQAQKMEAVGLLAGGIAHDFNNMLGVIIGYSDVAAGFLEPDHPVRKHIAEIRTAGDRAATLTRQLLAFSRQQVLQPMSLNLNSVIHDVARMLLRVIGEDVSLILKPHEPLGSVYADLGQLQQVLMNLAVNARDAMPNGGRLILETSNVEVDENAARNHGTVKPGSYVVLSISDTGIGMDPATAARVFDPFFTTKGPNRGTGLGLSTVYGIVKQSGGYISVNSKPLVGTTFKIHLPQVDKPAEILRRTETQETFPTGSETILVVEDDSSLREMVVEVLRGSGYEVLETGNFAEAIDFAQHYPTAIHLLISDVILPDMSGPELASHLNRYRPNLQPLYMSGYTGDLLEQKGVLDRQVVLLPKPFSKGALLTKVREILDQEQK